MRSGIIFVLLICCSLQMLTGCTKSSENEDSEEKIMEEQAYSEVKSETDSERELEAVVNSSEESHESSNVPLYDRTYLEKDGEGYIYRLSDAALIEKYDELYSDAFTSVVKTNKERISWMNQNSKSDQKFTLNNLVLTSNSESQVISTGSDFEMDYNFDLFNVGYTYVDLDSDGIFELIFGVLSYEYNDGLPMEVYERAFALSNGKVVKILEGGSRINQWLGSDGHIYEDGSGGAAYSGTWRLHFDKSDLNGQDVEWGNIAFKEDEFLGYWGAPVHINGPITDIDKMAQLPESQIADDEWQALEREWNSRRVKIDWLRMADYLNKYNH